MCEKRYLTISYDEFNQLEIVEDESHKPYYILDCIKDFIRYNLKLDYVDHI